MMKSGAKWNGMKTGMSRKAKDMNMKRKVIDKGEGVDVDDRTEQKFGELNKESDDQIYRLCT